LNQIDEFVPKSRPNLQNILISLNYAQIVAVETEMRVHWLDPCTEPSLPDTGESPRSSHHVICAYPSLMLDITAFEDMNMCAES